MSSSLLILGISSSPSYSQSLQQQLQQQSSQKEKRKENCQTISDNAQYHYPQSRPEKYKSLVYVDTDNNVHTVTVAKMDHYPKPSDPWITQTSNMDCSPFKGKIGKTIEKVLEKCPPDSNSLVYYTESKPSKLISISEYHISGDKLIQYLKTQRIHCVTGKDVSFSSGINTSEALKFR